jgi:triosephosphate isomerase
VTRSLLFAANWKMHVGPAEAESYALTFRSRFTPSPDRDTWFFPPAVSLAAAARGFDGLSRTRIGAQNIHWESKGAFTGETSAPLVKAAGGSAALIGHSERRHVFGETDRDTAKKLEAAIREGLSPVLCVGETLAEREAGATEQVVLRQLAAALEPLGGVGLDPLVVAYEPVWAIGTGKNATPADAAQVHRALRASLGKHGAASARILYGGSVNQSNVAALLSEPEIEGVLVGGASLDPEGWARICSTG